MNKNELDQIINGCRQGERLSQKRLYQNFYRYGMNVASRYARIDEEAEEMLNDAFVRIFSKIEMYDSTLSFVAWLHTIVVRSAINYLKKYENIPQSSDIELLQNQGINDNTLAQISADEIINLVKKLPNSYRMAFNLAVVEGYSHVEIAKMLGITEGTSRSNLMVARQKLKEMVSLFNKIRT